jgi:glycosyltransferase involved in cell wall biosynthesis
MTSAQLLAGQFTDYMFESAPLEIVDDVQNTYAGQRHVVWPKKLTPVARLEACRGRYDDRLGNSTRISSEMAEQQIRKVLYHHRTQGRGVEAVHIRGVVDALRGCGIAVVLLSLPNADPYQERSPAATKVAKPWKGLGNWLPEPAFEVLELAFNVMSVFRIARWIAHHRDASFIYERYSLFLFSTVWYARWRGIPIILEINDSATVPRVRGLFFKRLALAIERWTFRTASGLIFVSTHFRDICLRTHGSSAPAIVSPNAANIADFTGPAERRERARAQYGLGDSLVCGYLGAFVVWHRIDEFVVQVADQLAKAPQLKFLLVGDGVTYEKVRDFVRERGLESRIVLTGRVPHHEVAALLSAMDYAVLPDAGDYTSPVKLFEFMAAGVPAVAPDYGPIREVLVDAENGWFFPARDIPAAVEKVLAVSRDEAHLRQVAAQARKYIARERQWSNNIDQLLDLYRRVS